MGVSMLTRRPLRPTIQGAIVIRPARSRKPVSATRLRVPRCRSVVVVAAGGPEEKVAEPAQQLVNPEETEEEPDQQVLVEEHSGPDRLSRIQVERQSYIDIRKGAMVDMLQERDDGIDSEEWHELRASLRCIESIYRVEYLLVGDSALQSLIKVNAATIVPDGVQLVRSTDELDEAEIDDATDGWLDDAKRPDDWNTPGIPRVSYELDEDFLNKERIFLSPKEYQEEEEAFLDIFVKLINRGHFDSVTARDSAIADTLNSSYLGQCFIRPDGNKVDDSFASHLIEDTLRAELGCVAVFKRGWGKQHKTGRLLVPKLDFMQRSVAKTMLRSVTHVVKTMARVAGLRKKANKQKEERPGEAQEETPEEETQGASYLASSDSYLSRDSGEFLVGDGSIQGSDQADKDAALRTSVVKTRTKSPLEQLGDQMWRLLWDIRVGLAYYGLLPPVISYTLEEFKDTWPVAEARRHNSDVYIERTSIEDALGGDSMYQVLSQEGGMKTLFGKIELVEPTFREMVVLCREKSNPGNVKKLQMSYIDRALIFLKLRPKPREPLTQEQLHMRVYRDIPVPLWRIIYPFKALAFRPMDIIKVDLVAIAGLVAIIAQVKYGSAWLQLVWISSVLFQMYRVFSRYRKMFISFENFVSKTMLDKTVASQEGVIDVLAQSAAIQQYKLAVLLYYALLLDGVALLDDQEQAALRIERILEEMGCQVNFEVREAEEELIRLGLIKYKYRDNRAEKQLVKPDKAAAVLSDHWSMILKRQMQEPGEMHATFEEVMALDTAPMHENATASMHQSAIAEWNSRGAAPEAAAATAGSRVVTQASAEKNEDKARAVLETDEALIVEGGHERTIRPDGVLHSDDSDRVDVAATTPPEASAELPEASAGAALPTNSRDRQESGRGVSGNGTGGKSGASTETSEAWVQAGSESTAAKEGGGPQESFDGSQLQEGVSGNKYKLVDGDGGHNF